MFFKQVRRNAAKSRRSNELFFGSLVIAIVAFYTLLSLGDQDVMQFLKTVESDAVGKLMHLIPVVYIVSLFFVFFLVYFAYRYQLDNRRKEFGLYLMMGMRRSGLFAMLMSETIWNSLVSVLIGLPISLLLTEVISLATAKIVGIGIIGHRVSFSASAVLGTVIGFGLVQMIAMLFLCAELGQKEPRELLQTDSPDKQVSISKKRGWLCFIAGILLLIIAYLAGIFLMKSLNIIIILLICGFGASGTFLLYRGMGVFIGHRIQQKSPSKSGLFTFTARQIQENVLHQHKTLAIASLLILMALSCISFGIGIASARGSESARSVDFSIDGSEQSVSEFFSSDENAPFIAAYYPIFIGHMDTDVHEFSWGLAPALETQPKSDLRDNMIENFTGEARSPYIISQTSYNDLLRSIGKAPIEFEGNQVALYTSNGSSQDFYDILGGALEAGAYVEINDERYELLPDLYIDNIVADRKITLYSALIVPDEQCQNLIIDGGDEAFCWNVVLSDDIVQQEGLMQAIVSMGEKLTAAGLVYESYLTGIGRNLFYTVAASYLTIYLGVLFMLIANTVIGLKFLMQQRANKRRYLTLLMLGAGNEDISISAKKQIRLFFALVVGVAAFSSVFAVVSMFSSFLKLPAGASVSSVILLAGIGFLLFIMIEFVYITIVEKISRREIQALRVTDRR